MANIVLRAWWAGFLTGVAVSIFGLYLLWGAVPFTLEPLEQWQRIGVGAVGVVAVAMGVLLSRRAGAKAVPPDTSSSNPQR